ncbi:lantibiotic dehydratase [Actinomadura litoris]|uniref:lantibiotic dehydratase n=1 Tax=Actinomadura litoris TaxID=2678616 RepID=UPI001FA6EDC8|nr:lantibiotic dehydratase [Actinomadura litoris]
MSRHLYEPALHGLLRATRISAPLTHRHWPELTSNPDLAGWRAWLEEVWQDENADAIRLASPALALRVEAICAGRETRPKQTRRAVMSVVRYLLRATSRPTPFGLFAGVADLEFSPTAASTATGATPDSPAVCAWWGTQHQELIRASEDWLSKVIEKLEACPPLLARLPVVINSLRQERGDYLTVPAGAARVEIRRSPAMRAVEDAARSPIVFADLAAHLADLAPGVSDATITVMLTELVERRVLVTSLRAPGTTVDALGHLVAQLRRVSAAQIPVIAPTARRLETLHADLRRHNGIRGDAAPRTALRERLETQMRQITHIERCPLSMDLRLDCKVRLPARIAQDMAAAASVLQRLTTQPGGYALWREYHAAFLGRFGSGVLVPLAELLDPGAGLGYPGGYPGAVLPQPSPSVEHINRPADRDARLLAMVHRALMNGDEEVSLSDETVTELGADMEQVRIPAHVEVSARVHATDLTALKAGDYTLTITPTRAAGTMTGRFTGAGSPMARVFADLHTAVTEAVSAQVSVPMAYPHADNVARTEEFLPHLIALGEHRPSVQAEPAQAESAQAPSHERGRKLIDVNDLAVTADFNQLYLVSPKLGRVVEPLFFHALRLDKQPPPLARFLVALVRGRSATYTEFDWGMAAELPYLPRVRYGRCVLSVARWRITSADLPGPEADWPSWTAALERWRRRWRTPPVVELREDDRVLRLDTTVGAHAAILRDHLHRAGHAVLLEASDPAGNGWLDGHAHQVVAVMRSTRPPVASPLADSRPRPVIASTSYGQLPGAVATRWLSARLYAPPDLHPAIIGNHLSALLADLAAELDGEPDCWWLRYRAPDDPHHLRLRVRIHNPAQYGATTAVVGQWAARLRAARLATHLTFDTYYPEVGRYGDGPAMGTAEQVFVADSNVVRAQLASEDLSTADDEASLTAVTTANLVALATGFTGNTAAGMRWLIDHATPSGVQDTERPDRLIRGRALALTLGATPLGQHPVLGPLWRSRHLAMSRYRQQLPSWLDPGQVLASLLHMHCIRALGTDRPAERRAMLLARAAALSWRDRPRSHSGAP